MIHVKRHRKKYGSDNYEIGASVEINYDCNPNELCIFICIFVFISAFIQSSLHAFHRMTAYVITYEMWFVYKLVFKLKMKFNTQISCFKLLIYAPEYVC